MSETQTVATSRKAVWWRGAYMLAFIIAFGIGQAVINLIAIIQFLTMLISGRPNPFLADFGKSLGTWFAAVAAFQSGESEAMPFPWAPWPRTR